MTGPRITFAPVAAGHNIGVSNTLPRDARDALIAASRVYSSTFERGQDLARNVAIESAVQRVRRLYPQFFTQE